MNKTKTIRRNMHDELADSQRTGYIVWKNGKPPTADHSFWWWCESMKKPYVRVTTRRKKARVRLDLPYDVPQNEDVSAQIVNLLRGFGYPAQNGGRYSGAEDLPVELAEKLAEGLVKIGREACARRYEQIKKQNFDDKNTSVGVPGGFN